MKRTSLWLLLGLVALLGTSTSAQEPEKPKHMMEIYGFAMTDVGYDFNQNDPAWFDVMRPTKLPAFDNEFGTDGRTYFGVRQSRLGVKTFNPTLMGELKTTFEFEMFGVGVDAGQTTIRLRHAYGELGHFGAGQYWSPFMDIDVFPNSVEYWGPNAMVFFRNVHLRWMPLMREDLKWTIALERPGSSQDVSNYAERVELEGVTTRFPLPDLSTELRYTGGFGYVEAAGILRYIKWDDLGTDAFDIGGHAIGWGVNLSSNLKLGKKAIFKLQAVYGQGIANYMNDAPADLSAELNPSDPTRPINGVALPLLGLMGFVDVNWHEKWTSTAGYSHLWVQNTDGQTPDAFRMGQYALANIMYYPVPEIMAGPEFQWGRRSNHSDGFSVDDFRIQFSAKYNFGKKIGP